MLSNKIFSVKQDIYLKNVFEHRQKYCFDQLTGSNFISHFHLLHNFVQSLSVESNISRLKAYILFLSKYHEDGDPDFFPNLTDGLSYLIRHRYDITKKVLHSADHAKDRSIYFALLDLFGAYLENQLNSIDSDDYEDNQV